MDFRPPTAYPPSAQQKAPPRERQGCQNGLHLFFILLVIVGLLRMRWSRPQVITERPDSGDGRRRNRQGTEPLAETDQPVRPSPLVCCHHEIEQTTESDIVTHKDHPSYASQLCALLAYYVFGGCEMFPQHGVPPMAGHHAAKKSEVYAIRIRHSIGVKIPRLDAYPILSKCGIDFYHHVVG